MADGRPSDVERLLLGLELSTEHRITPGSCFTNLSPLLSPEGEAGPEASAWAEARPPGGTPAAQAQGQDGEPQGARTHSADTGGFLPGEPEMPID